ncbi:hypothetical protein CR513_16800, partial [Mucuna pruriens]
MENNHFGQGQVKGHMQLSNSDLPQMSNRLSTTDFTIPDTIVPIVETTESASSRQLTISRGPNEAVSNKQPGVPTNHELQQYTVLAKYECHHPRPQDANKTVSKHCEPITIGQIRQPTLTNNSEFERE